MKVPKPRKLSSGNWFIQMRLGGESVSITETTEKSCIKSAQVVKAEYLAGKRESKPEKPSITLSKAIDGFRLDNCLQQRGCNLLRQDIGKLMAVCRVCIA